MQITMTRSTLLVTAVSLSLLLLAAGRPARGEEVPLLRQVFAKDFLIGAALNRATVTGADGFSAIIARSQFSAATPENDLKWEMVHPRPGVYSFEGSDAFVSFCESNRMTVIGHTLVWHSQTPKWVFENAPGKPVDRATLIERMRDHIHTVVGHYKGRIHGWDVVNEALAEDGTLRQSPWLKIIGKEYLVLAFRFAHEADPSAELYYNDYSLQLPAKRKGALALIRRLQKQGVPVNAVGLQDHIRLDWPKVEEMDQAIADFAALGIKVNITELDIDVLPQATQPATAEVSAHAGDDAKLNPYAKTGLPAGVQDELATRYAAVFGVYLKHKDVIQRVTFWGVTDRTSWLNNWPVRGRTSFPLLFDWRGMPKPAFHAVVKVAEQ
jgi:endo-1,4-beta-xylanase